MTDACSTNQSRTPGHQWAGQNGWSAASPPLGKPLPSFQQLSLGPPSDQRPGRDHLQVSNPGCLSDLRNNSQSMAFTNNSDLSVQHFIPNARVSHVVPTSSQERNVPPCSLPLTNKGSQPSDPQQISEYSPHSPYQAISAPFHPPYSHHVSLNGPQSMHQTPISPPSFRQCANQNPRRAHQPAFEKANMESAVGAGYFHNAASPNSPVQQQPQWALPPQSRGNIKEFVPSAVQDGSISPQSPHSESRYGLDPELLPNAVKVMAEDRAEWEGKVFVSEPFSQLPPLATTSCIVEDRGNTSPFAIRSTSYCLPCEGQTALLSRLPLGALVAPLSKQNAGEPVPLCEEPECVLGCSCCGASMCRAMGWQDCGQRFYCPFCGKLSEVSWQHYQPTSGVEGARVDKDKRPELSMGSYEILHSQKGEPAALLLAIDVSASALRGGHLEFVTQQIRSLLHSLNSEDGDALSDVRVGLMTYDSRIHLYDLSPALSRPHMLVIMETEDLQLPVTEGLLVSLKDCIHSVDSVLQLIPQFSAECDDSSGVPMELPVKAGLAILQALSSPGKLLIFHTASLTEMVHTSSSSGFFGSNKPKSIFQPSEPAISLAKECVRQGCGVHLFVLSQQDVGGAWPGHIPYLSGGALHSYSHLQGDLDRECFSTDLKRIIETHTGYRAELRIFVSKDLRVSGCYGLFLPGPRPSQVAMATLDQWTTLAVELSHTRGLDEKRGVAIQTVLSYSTQTGDRRTRVHTLTLRCSRHLQDAFCHYQAQTLLTFYSKKMYCAVLERPLQELREELQTEVTEALASYRKHCSSSSVSAGQLVLPQYLRALPVYINSLRKSEVLLPGLRNSVHQRLQQRCQVLGMDTSGTATHFYPQLLPLQLSAEDSNPPSPEQALRCRALSLEPRGLYLVHAPLTLLLWVGAQVPASTLVELFNTSCFSALSSGETKLPVLENPLSISIRSLVDTLNSQVPCARKLWVVKQGDTCEEALQRHLVEDKSPNGGASYADFLYHLHINSVRLLQ
nr:PREDICTED: protein transport protein Sec24C-like isoform X2 [Paralichthys olivaceus]